MIFDRIRRAKELRMIWEVRQDSRRSLLVGSAHFFPFSFEPSLRRYLRDMEVVLLEGPLDHDSMARVVAAGTAANADAHLFDLLDRRTVARVTAALFPACETSGFQALSRLALPGSPEPVRELVSGLKPWLAFFTLWSTYLKSRGWQHSVDLEVHHTALKMGRRVVFLETIEEQIRVLENLPQERFLEFLKATPRWEEYTRSFVRLYLRGEAGQLKAMTRGFPSRHASVIDGRDRILYERALPYLENGDALVCVGAPHIEGISAMLQADGFDVARPGASKHGDALKGA